MRKMLLCVAPATATLLVLAVPALAGPPNHWFSNGKLIGPETVHVKTTGTLTFDLTQFGVTLECKVKDLDNISNPASGGPGTDEMTTFKLTGCKEAPGQPLLCPAPSVMEVRALALPWATHLAEEPPAPGVRDLIEGISLEFRCSKKGKVFGVVTGTLNPKVGNSVFEYEGGKALMGPFGAVTVTGTDILKGPMGDKVITAA